MGHYNICLTLCGSIFGIEFLLEHVVVVTKCKCYKKLRIVSNVNSLRDLMNSYRQYCTHVVDSHPRGHTDTMDMDECQRCDLPCHARDLACTRCIAVVANNVSIDIFLNNVRIVVVVHLHFDT